MRAWDLALSESGRRSSTWRFRFLVRLPIALRWYCEEPIQEYPAVIIAAGRCWALSAAHAARRFARRRGRPVRTRLVRVHPVRFRFPWDRRVVLTRQLAFVVGAQGTYAVRDVP